MLSQFKCLWNLAGRSPKFAGKFKSKIGVALKHPVVTRWNSLYDSVLFLNQLFNEGKMSVIQQVKSEYNSEKTGARFAFSLSERDHLFIDEFILVN